MDFAAEHRRDGSRRRGSALILLAIAAALMGTMASPASATPNSALAWGLNNEGQLGDGTREGPEKCAGTTACSTTPVGVANLSGVTAVAGGYHHSLALLESGKVMAWGENGRGQLGNGTTVRSVVPVEVSGLSEVAAIAAGERYSLALLKNGKLMAWGANDYGLLGNGTKQDSDVPVEVTGLSEPVTAIAAAEDHALAVLANGSVMAWGYGGGGDLGNGTTEKSEVPVGVCAAGTVGPCPTGPYLSEVTAVAGGGGAEHSLALLKNGTVMSWGANGSGQLGNGSEASTDVPVAVKGLSEVTAIAGGRNFSVALLNNGGVRAWGSNEKGQLAQGVTPGPEFCGKTFACSTSPVAVSGLNGVTAIAAANQGSVLALLENTKVKSWGVNGEGQLGDGTSTGPEVCGTSPCSNIPVEVSKLNGTKGIGAGFEHGLAFGPPPVVTKLNPTSGPVNGGTTVTITGTDLAGASAVKFGSTSATSFTVNSASSITALSPAQPAGRVDVTVTTPWGTSAISVGDRFTFTPTVTGLSPKSGPSAGGTSVTVSGTGFVAGTTATRFRFGATRATSVNCTSTTSCTVVSPVHAAGVVDVIATVNRASSKRNRPADRFEYT